MGNDEAKKESWAKRWAKGAGQWCLRQVRPILKRVVREKLLPLVKAEIDKGADKLYERVEEKALEFIDKL